MQRAGHNVMVVCVLAFVWMVAAVPALAQAPAFTLPSAADASRVAPATPAIAPPAPRSFEVPALPTGPSLPANAKDITFTLKRVNIEGMTAFSDKDMRDFYAPMLGTDISLDRIWALAERITAHYREHRYFLSRAYVPKQDITDGTVTLRVVEGYVGTVSFDGNLRGTTIAEALARSLTATKPLRVEQLESFMLRLNDLPGITRFGVLSPSKNASQGAVDLIIEQGTAKTRTQVSVDNYGSRFLGPHQATVSHKAALLPMQETTLTLSSSIPLKELGYASLKHRVPVSETWDAFGSVGYVRARPGATLKPNDIRSNSIDVALGLVYTPIRQWEQNLAFTFQLDGKNSESDILKDVPLTRDRVRAFRTTAQYDVTDGWQGGHALNLTLSRGLGGLGSSDRTDPFISRSEATPNFTKGEFSYAQQRRLLGDFLITGSAAGQYASGPLFSSEEFGYGGQAFGRAYDPSDIIGDHGIAGALELRYAGFDAWRDMLFAPYLFADAGKVWNEDAGVKPVSGTSAGFGLRMAHETGVSGDLGLAWPLTRTLSTPVYGSNSGPRILFQMQYGF
ncbi:MAG: hypothetical protein C0436_04615 [Alphaproteobacteria bacterium]|nr:hypothetical protein [Alphaproteobacteria bacterium]